MYHRFILGCRHGLGDALAHLLPLPSEFLLGASSKGTQGNICCQVVDLNPFSLLICYLVLVSYGILIYHITSFHIMSYSITSHNKTSYPQRKALVFRFPRPLEPITASASTHSPQPLARAAFFKGCSGSFVSCHCTSYTIAYIACHTLPYPAILSNETPRFVPRTPDLWHENLLLKGAQ